MRRVSLMIGITMLWSALAFAQAPAAALPPTTPQTAAPRPVAPAGGIAVIDFMKAITGNGEGTKATNRLLAENNKRMAMVQAKQKEGQDASTDLQAKAATLTDAQKVTLQKKIDQAQTDLTRMNEDFQREMQDMQQQQLAPIAEIVKTVLSTYARERNYAVVFDTSGETNNLVYVNSGTDITAEVIVKVDEETAKRPAPSAPRPATPAPAAPKVPAAPPTKPAP